MPLISCPDCGTEHSSEAVSCPKCARPNKPIVLHKQKDSSANQQVNVKVVNEGCFSGCLKGCGCLTFLVILFFVIVGLSIDTNDDGNDQDQSSISVEYIIC